MYKAGEINFNNTVSFIYPFFGGTNTLKYGVYFTLTHILILDKPYFKC